MTSIMTASGISGTENKKGKMTTSNFTANIQKIETLYNLLKELYTVLLLS